MVQIQSQPQKLTFAEYLAYEDNTDNRYELIDGELVALAPESPDNDFIALNLRDEFISLTRRSLVRPHTCEIQVPILQRGDAANRYADLVVLREEHLALMGKRLTITLEMPPPQLIAEVVSPYRSPTDENYRRDYRAKRRQYAALAIPEYWIVDPSKEQVMVLQLEAGQYLETSFRGESRLVSHTFPALDLIARQVFDPAD